MPGVPSSQVAVKRLFLQALGGQSNSHAMDITKESYFRVKGDLCSDNELAHDIVTTGNPFHWDGRTLHPKSTKCASLYFVYTGN